jgi:hypothetical protein
LLNPASAPESDGTFVAASPGRITSAQHAEHSRPELVRFGMLGAEAADLLHEISLELGVRPAVLALGQMGIDCRHVALVELAVEVVPEGANDSFTIGRKDCV